MVHGRFLVLVRVIQRCTVGPPFGVRGGLFGVRSGFRSWSVRDRSVSVGYRSGSFISVVPLVCTGGVDPLPHCLA